MGEKTDVVEVERKQVIHTVKTLKALHKKWQEEGSKKKPLLDEVEDTPVMLQITLKKIPDLKNVKMIKIPLTHSLITDTTEVCLLTGDLDKRDKKAELDPTILHYKELLEKHEIKCISEVIPLRQLRTEYKPFEAKRKLAAAYNIFLADSVIAGCLPRVLGKGFFKKRKFPQQVDLTTEFLKSHIEKALAKTVLFLSGKGNSCCLEIAYMKWSVKDIADNVMAAVAALKEKIPGSFDNVNGLYIKVGRSKALPIYMSLSSGDDVYLPPTTVPEDVEEEEITSLKRTKVKVFPGGNVQLIEDNEYQPSDSDSDYEIRLLDEQNTKKRKPIHTKGKNVKKAKKIKKSND